MENFINEIAMAVSETLKIELMSFIKREIEKIYSAESEKLVSVQEASKIFKVHPNTIRNWISRNELQSVSVGGRVYVTFKNLKS